MGAFMDRYNRMKGIGTVPDTVQAEGEDSSSVPASEVKPGAFTERYNKLLEARAADMSHSLSEWSAANDTLAHSYGSYSGEELAKQTDALRMSGESLKQRIRDSGLYDDDTVTALGEGIDSWNRVHDIYRRDLDLAAGRAEREQATAELPASSLPVYGQNVAETHHGKESSLEDKILYAQASVDMLESKLENSKGKIPSPEQLMSGDAGIDGNDEIKAALKEKKKELEQLLKERQESEIAERREENGLSDGSHVPSSPAQDVEAVLSAKSEYFNPDDNKDPYGNDLRPAVNTVNNIARAGDRVKDAGDLAMSAFSAGIDRSIVGIGDAARTAYETVKGTADRLAGLNQIPELKKYSPAAPKAEKSLTKRLEDAAVAGNRAVDNYLLSGDTYTDRSEKDTVMQDYLYRRENRTLGKAGNVIADLAENFGYQMPNMLLTHGFGLTGLSSNAATAIMFGSPAYVSNRRELLEEGYSSAEADLYGKAGFLIEGVGESLFGSAFGTVPAIGRKLGFSIIDNITNPVVRTLMVYLVESGEEGLEEVAQSFLEAAAKSAITGEDFELDAREVAYEGILGAISGGVLGSIGLGQRLRAAGQVHAADVDYVNTLSVNAESVGTAAEAAGMIGALEKQRAALSKMTDETTGLEDTARRVKYLDTALEALSETLKEKFSLAAEITPQGGYEVKDKRNPIERAKDSLTADARSAGSVELALEAASRAADADSAAEAIAALEMQRQRISELGRTGFTARYEDRKMLEAEMKLRDRFGIDGTYFGASVDGKYTSEADGARYSIEQTDRGKPVVVIDTDILNGVSDADKKNAVRKFISQNYPNGIRVGNGVIEITGKTGREYTRSGYSRFTEKNDGQVFDDKLRAAGNLDEAVRASTDYVNEEIKHPRKDNIKEFARGRVLMRVGQNDYNAEVVVGYTQTGEMLLYDIVNFKPDTFSVKERTPRRTGPDKAGMTETNEESSSDNSISQNNAAVNSQYTQESENDASDTAENGADTAEVGADEGDFAVDRKGSDVSAAFSDEALDREGYTPTEQTRVIAMNEATRTGREYGASPAQQAAAEELSHILDRRIVFFRSDDPTVNGYYKNGTIHVNAASGRTVASIIASEMTHAIETTSDYGALRELALRELSREKGMSLDELRAQKKETYAAHGENLDADGVDFELCEEYVGRYLFGDVAQIRAAVDYKPSLGRKIIAFLDEIIRRLTGRVRAVSSRILKDVQYARELWGRAVREAKARDAEDSAAARHSFAGRNVQNEITERYRTAVDNVLNMQNTASDNLIIGYTPKLMREMGMPSLPMVIGTGHVYSIAKTAEEAKQDGNYHKGVHYHGLGESAVKNIYTALCDPVMVIASKDVNPNAAPMRSTHSIVAIIDIGKSNQSLLLPVEITAERTVYGDQMDVNVLSSAYNKDVSALVKEAIALENSGDIGIYYAKKEAAALVPAGVQFPIRIQGSTASDIIIHRLNEKVNMQISDATQSRQFKRWFGDWQNHPESASKIVNEVGTPKVVYHGTGANFTVFKSESGTYWFSESTDYAEAMAEERAGKNGRVGAFYLDMKNPYRAKLPPGQFTDPGYEKPIIEKAKSGGYDGVIIENDTDSDIEAETFYVVFSPNQIKSATDNIGTFDRGNNDTRYSIEDSDYEMPITPRDVEAVQSIGRKSINAFTSEEIRKTQKWAHKFYRELGTKSPFFRAWFGDWCAHDTGEVKVAEIPEYAATNEARKANRGTVRNNDTGWDIRISRDGETNTISHAGGDKLSEYGLAGIRGLTENGVLLDSEVHEHHTNNAKNDMIAFDHKLYAVGRDTSGNVALYKITVEEAYHDHKHTNERRFHNLKYIEKVATVGGRTAGQSLPGVSTNDDIATTYTVADILSLVKTYDKDFTAAHDVSPELLNEDGTPKVFYHGTMYDFTEFRSEEISPAEGSYFFAENREDAEGYGSERYGGHVMEVYLSAENLADYNDQPSEFYQLKDKREQVQWLKERGYDGWYADMDSGGWGEVSVFSPNQIKSATDNIGTFDRGNNDTRYSIEDSGWDAYHRRNQEELESNTAAAERARREERAEERAAAEDEARDRLDTLAKGGTSEDRLFDSAKSERGNIERENMKAREATMTQEEYERIIGKPLTEEEAADLREEISKAAGSIAAEEGLYSAAEEERLFLEEERTAVAPKWFEQVKKSGSLADEITAENKRQNSKLGKYIREHGADIPDVSASDFAEAAVKEVYGDSLSDKDAERQKKRIETEAEAVRDAEKAYAAEEAEGKRMSDEDAESTKEDRSGNDGENVRLHPKNPDPNSKSGRKQLREAAQATYAETLKRLKPTEAEIAFAEKLASGEQYAANIPDDMNARRVEAVTSALRAIRYYSGAKDGGGALQRLGVKIESPLVSNYSDAAYLRGWEDARRNSKEAIYEAVAKYQISKKEGVIARSVADGILDIDEVNLHSNFARFKVAHLADLYRTADIYAANAITAQRSRTAAKFQPSLDAILGGMDGERLNKRSQARLNLNTMVRNNLAVFGEVKGAQINSLLFRPIQLNEAERMRFVNDHVEEFTNNYGKVTKTESALVQMLMEGRLDTALLQSGISEAKKDARRRFDLNGTQIETAETEVAAKQALEAEKKNLKQLKEQIEELKTKRDSMILRKIDGDISEVGQKIAEAEKEAENSKRLLDLYGELERLAALKKSELEKDSESENAERAKTLKKIDGDISEVEKKISEAEEDIKSEKTLLGLKGELRSLEDWKKSVLEKNPKSTADSAETVKEIDDKLRKTEEAIARTEKKAKKKEHDIEIERAVKKQYLRLLELRNERVKIDSEIAAYEAMKDEKIDVRRISSIANYLRGKYAEFYEATNDFLVTHGYRPIGFIKNYAPHMQPEQMTKLSEALHALGVSPDLVKAFDASLKRLGIGEDVSSLPVEIAGRTGDFKPGKKWNPHYLTRTGERTEFDALAGYNGYVSLASEVFYHTDDIQKLRQFNQTLRTMYSGSEVKNSVAALHEKMRSGALSFEEGNAKIESMLENVRDNALSPYVTVLENYTNVIAGKQTMGDRASEAEFGRAALSTSGKIRGVFARAAITGNVSSALAQVVQLPMVVSECGNGNLMRAIWDVATQNLNKKTDFDSRSVFITGKRGTNRVAAELAGAEKVADIAVNKVGMFLFETVDDVASRLIVRTKYLQLIRAGVGSDAALALADEYADSVVGSRMKGAKPMMFCNKSFVKGLFTMFQLEVANSWAHIDQDIPADIRKMSRTKGKKAAIKYTAALIVKYLLGAFFLDRLADELYGQTPVQFDVLGYVAESLAAGSGMSTNTYLRTMLDNAIEKLLKARPFNTEAPEKDRKFDASAAASALAEGILGDVPAAQNILGMLGMSETKFPLPRIWSDSASSALEKITSGDADVAAKGWRQFGSAALSNVATWFPFGNQLNKSIRGIYAIARKGSYDYSGRLQYPAGDSVFEKGAAVLFGKSAFNSNADFWAGGSRALSEEATEAYKLMLKYGMSQVEAYRLVKELSSQKADRAEKEEVDVSGMDGFDALAARYFTNDEAEGASGANDFDTLAAKYFGEGDEDEEAEDLSRRVINRQIEIINSDKYDLTDEQKYRVFSEVCASSKAADVMAALDEAGAERGEIYRLISSIAATKNTDEEPRAVAHLIRDSALTGEQKAIAYYALAASKKERQVQKELDDLGENSADVWEMLDSCTELRKNEADEERFEKARRVIRESEISKKGKAEAYYLLAASAKDREFMDKVGGDFDMGEIADTLSRLRDCGKQGEKAQVLVDSSGLTVYEKRTVFLERVCTESNRAKKEEALEKIEDAGGSAETYLKALSAVGKATYTKGETLGKSYAYKKAIDRVARGTRLRYALYEVFDVSEKVW